MANKFLRWLTGGATGGAKDGEPGEPVAYKGYTIRPAARTHGGEWLTSGLISKEIDGEMKHVGSITEGQYFGERALLKQEPRMATTVACAADATARVECFSLSKADFDALALSDTVRWSESWDKEDTRDLKELKVLRAMGSGVPICLAQARAH